MRKWAALLMVTVHVHVLAQAPAGDPVISPNWAQETAPARPRIDSAREEAIREAVREEIGERDYRDTRSEAFRADGTEKFGRDFEEARVPGCHRPDALKRQPTGWGPIQFVGLLAVPFILVAKVRGKCN